MRRNPLKYTTYPSLLVRRSFLETLNSAFSFSNQVKIQKSTSSSSRLEFKKHHETALKSANETKYWLGLLRDSGKSDMNRTNKLLQEVTEIANMIAYGILKLKGKL